MYATQVLPQNLSEDDPETDNVSEVTGFLIVDDQKHEIKKGETKIGRDCSMCSVVIENFTISKVHAVIESEGKDDIFIYDVGSTNQTKLGKKILKPHCRYKLENNSKITLGNVIAKFLVPSDKSFYENLTTVESTSGNFGTLDQLGDIFDLPTQVNVHVGTSSKASNFEQPPENFQIFKVPTSAPYERSSELLRSCFDEETQCKLYSQEAKSKAVCSNSSLKSSNIFSLSTQFQLYEPSTGQANNCDAKTTDCANNQKHSESSKLKSLLNDGQDDLLCIFMLHNEEKNSGLFNNVKTENTGQALNAESQAQVEIIQEINKKEEKKEMTEVLQNKCLKKEFYFCTNKPSITGELINPLQCNLDCSVEQFDKSNTCSQHQDEDFIKTQEFNINSSKLVKHSKNALLDEPDDQSQDSQETQLYLEHSLNNLHSTEQKNEDEDLIFTQAFEILEKKDKNKRATAVIPESDDLSAGKEDFCETQIFPIELEKQKVLREDIVARSKYSTPDRDLDSTQDFIPKNNKHDVIASQVKVDFIEKIDVKQTQENSERSESDDNEDFIATQVVELEIRKPTSYITCQEKLIPSQESSPDLLVPETSLETFEDSISTQIFKSSEHQNSLKTLPEISKETFSSFCNRLKKETNKYNNIHSKMPETMESSGDETESDLEILLGEDKITEKEEVRNQKFVKLEPKSSDSILPAGSLTMQENNDSNSSYIFEVEPKSSSEKVATADIDQNSKPYASDSDETDCEEVVVLSSKHFIKKPTSKSDFEETQGPNSIMEKTSERSYCMSSSGDPEFEVENGDHWSPLSLEMPSTQNFETIIKRISRKETEKCLQEEVPSKMKKTEVGIKIELSERQVYPPVKRPRESNAEAVPSKKYKTQSLDKFLKTSEKQLLKLVKAHDIAQIQPSRTRNSFRKLLTENKRENDSSNERPTCRRKTNPRRGGTVKKINSDATQYLTKKVERRTSGGKWKKEAFPNENYTECTTRVLRSSTRNSGGAAPLNKSVLSRNFRQNFRTKNEDFTSPNVVFTGFGCEALEKIISDLGGAKTNDLRSGKVVVADKVRRTVKFLCAIGLSLPITSPQWLLTCKKEKKFINPWDFILKDEEAEKRWDFELKGSLEKSKKMKLFEGFNFFATRSTKPPVKDLLEIVECCGGHPLFGIPNVWPRNTIFVSCLDDQKFWPSEKCRNVKIVHYEFILSGVLKQKVDFKTYSLR